jgi:ubiquinone/menaquinone biosynthesis C-methylase UbiE
MTTATRSEKQPYVPALRFRFLTRWFDRVLQLTLRERELKQALIDQAGIEPGQRVLDIGVGTATLALMIKDAQPTAQVVGIDGDPEILGLAMEKIGAAGRRVELREAMADALPFETASFDRVVSSLVFHHLTRDAKLRALEEARRVLAPNGSLHILDWGKAQSLAMRAAFLQVQVLDGFETTGDNVRGELVSLMREAGFMHAEETLSVSTILGTISLYRATPR